MTSITIITLTSYNAQELDILGGQVSEINDERVEWYIKSGEQDEAGHSFLRKLQDDWQSKVVLKIDTNKDSSIYDGMNMAVMNSSSTYYCWFNPDDELVTTNFKSLLDKNFKSDFVVFPLWEANSMSPNKFKGGKIATKGTRAKFNGFATSLLVRRDIHNYLGLFDLKYYIASDIDFLSKALKDNQVNIEYAESAIGRFGIEGTSSRLSQTLIRECAEIYFRHYGLLIALILTFKIIIFKIRRLND